MKYFFLVVICVYTGFVLFGCGESLTDSRYKVALPELPPLWRELLDSPRWRVEWLNSEGKQESMSIRDKETLIISLPAAWAGAVSAWPYWPERGIGPGIFRPAGGIFPFDVSGEDIVLSWRGGVDAALFWELARAYDNAAAIRLPWNFNWPGFRELFEAAPGEAAQSASLNAEILADPWLADWSGIAAKIVQTGFDKRRLVPETRVSLNVPVGPGPWIGTSPFAAPLLFDGVPYFPVRPSVDTWVSAEGLVRCNTKAWIFIANNVQ